MRRNGAKDALSSYRPQIMADLPPRQHRHTEHRQHTGEHDQAGVGTGRDHCIDVVHAVAGFIIVFNADLGAVEAAVGSERRLAPCALRGGACGLAQFTALSDASDTAKTPVVWNACSLETLTTAAPFRIAGLRRIRTRRHECCRQHDH